MFVFGLVAVYIFLQAVSLEEADPLIIVVEVLILNLIAIFGLTFVVAKIWEMNQLAKNTAAAKKTQRSSRRVASLSVRSAKSKRNVSRKPQKKRKTKK